MGLLRSCMQWLSSLEIIFLLFALSDAYEPMDPSGNITIKWDFLATQDDGAPMVTVTIYNNQLYRHIEAPGWRLSWTWAHDEVIWNMLGAEATERGNCSRFQTNIPHSCEKTPVIVDLSIGTAFNMQSANCCKNGVLMSLVQDSGKSLASFQMTIGKDTDADNGAKMTKPGNFSIGVPGYSCSDMVDVAATRFKVSKQRTIQALYTWQVICTYSQFRESSVLSCCVSLSTFYSETIVPCPRCSCGCQPSSTESKCLRDGENPDPLELPDENEDGSISKPLVRCTQHMCPIRVHWHIKNNYKGYWRVKVTITNFNVRKNYSDWTLVMQHPDLYNITHIYSFQYKPLLQYGNMNDTGMFWGIKTYNNLLLQDGNVQTEMVLGKNPDFTFGGGWGLPRRISFNGRDCAMPSPDQYPTLPNMTPKMVALSPIGFIFELLVVLLISFRDIV